MRSAPLLPPACTGWVSSLCPRCPLAAAHQLVHPAGAEAPRSDCKSAIASSNISPYRIQDGESRTAYTFASTNEFSIVWSLSKLIILIDIRVSRFDLCNVTGSLLIMCIVTMRHEIKWLYDVVKNQKEKLFNLNYLLTFLEKGGSYFLLIRLNCQLCLKIKHR